MLNMGEKLNQEELEDMMREVGAVLNVRCSTFEVLVSF